MAGLGRVGAGLARLLATEGAALTMTDVDPAKRGISDELGCRAVVGPANNQLATPDVADLIHAVSVEVHRLAAEEARARVDAIEDTVTELLRTAESQGRTPAQAAGELARRRLAATSDPAAA
ncbi:hypothetical protein ACGFZB_38785 [Streptomyces cinerochromogenes]|uniref:6-phosphogluconate dehydrogenase NADP-binding domain-containing protein n=1 Tax=Streptomyces cinerochromogenes TaxID=66422 RepID=A0ABW7BHP0_9ACTN